jgi:hypothetical protein
MFAKLVFPVSAVCIAPEMFCAAERRADVMAPAGIPSGTDGKALTCKPVIVLER